MLKSVFLKYFHVKSPQNNIDLFQNPTENILHEEPQYKICAVKMFHVLKTAHLQAHVVMRYEL